LTNELTETCHKDKETQGIKRLRQPWTGLQAKEEAENLGWGGQSTAFKVEGVSPPGADITRNGRNKIRKRRKPDH